MFVILPSSVLYPLLLRSRFAFSVVTVLRHVKLATSHSEKHLFQSTPCITALPEKLTVPHVVKNLSEFYRIRRFITAFKRASHLSLPLA